MGRYGLTSSFASCPAATGGGLVPCPHFPDGAHRCGSRRDHADESAGHLCTCGLAWLVRIGMLADSLTKAVPIINRDE